MANYIIGADLMKLPAVLYYKKGDKKHGISKKGDKKHGITGMKHNKHKSKHAAKVIDKRDNNDGGRRDVVFLSRPADYSPTKSSNSDQPPTTSYNLFDYKGNYRNWLFLYPEQHPVNMHYVDQGKAADPNQQNGAQQQAAGTQDATAAATAPAVGAPAAAAASSSAPAPATAASAATAAVAPEAQAASQATAAAAAPAVAQPAAPAVADPAVAAAANPAVPQVGQAAAAAVQQPAVPVAAQQPVAAQPEAANETIQLINQTVSLAANNTFEPTVANVSQTNQTIMVGSNNTSNQTVAPGNVVLVNNVISLSLK